MEQELDPQETPGDGTESGQREDGEQQASGPAAAPDPTARQLEELAAHNKELQSRLTRLGREMAEIKRGSGNSQPEQTAGFFDDPDRAMARFKQEIVAEIDQRRQTERVLRDFAEERGIPPRELERLNDKLQRATGDPHEYLEILAGLHAAENATTAVQRAAQASRETAERNARAVTAEGGATRVSPPGKSFGEMTLEEQRAYLIKKHGLADNQPDG